jgi:lauroyl/myristoyl acyltransferase
MPGMVSAGLWCAACPNRGPSGDSGFAADLAWRRQGPGVQVLEGNLRRVIGSQAPGGELRALSRQAMRSYARYWLEAFRLPVMPAGRLIGGVHDTGHIRAAFEYLAAGRGVVFALPHMGNYDLAGAWVIAKGGRVRYGRGGAGEAGVGLRQVRRVPRGEVPWAWRCCLPAGGRAARSASWHTLFVT